MSHWTLHQSHCIKKRSIQFYKLLQCPSITLPWQTEQYHDVALVQRRTYTLSPWACGPRFSVYISEIPCTHGIKTHGSESRGQEEAGLRDERVSYLQVTPL